MDEPGKSRYEKRSVGIERKNLATEKGSILCRLEESADARDKPGTYRVASKSHDYV